MKEKIKKIKISKSQIITIVLAAIVAVIFSFGTSYAANIMFDSKDVGFDNTGTKIQATTVQGAIDELYSKATDYSSMNTRVNGVEETIGNNALTTTNQTLIGAVNELNDHVGSFLKSKNISGNTDNNGFIYLDLSQYQVPVWVTGPSQSKITSLMSGANSGAWGGYAKCEVKNTAVNFTVWYIDFT